MKKQLFILLVLITTSQTYAQFFKPTAIDVNIGYGLTMPYDDIDITNSGFYAQAEYILEASKWFDVRPYAGLILTSNQGKDLDGNSSDYSTSTKALLIGGKARLTIPIPYVAPYIELGVGTSIGKFRTYTPYTDIKHSGFAFHLPITLGLELGKDRNVDLAFVYYSHQNQEQISGAFAIGIAIPLKPKI